MDKNFEVEVVRVEGIDVLPSRVAIRREIQCVELQIQTGLASINLVLLHPEAVTIGEQLIAAGKAEG